VELATDVRQSNVDDAEVEHDHGLGAEDDGEAEAGERSTRP
jgi:hypothetical protein